MNLRASFVALALALALATSPAAFAGERTVTLSVPGMTCAACPITVKQALGKVPGVKRTAVDLDRREARVTFDDTGTSVDALLRATRDAGYPSTVAAGGAK